MNSITGVYYTFLNYFPVGLHSWIALILAILLIYTIIKIIQRDFIFIILLVVLLPASLPVLTNLWHVVWSTISFLLTK